MVNIREKSTVSALEKHSQIIGLFRRLGANPQENINIILEQICHILDGYCSLYHRIDDAKHRLVIEASFNKPDNFFPEFTIDGPVYREVFSRGIQTAIDIPDVTQSYHMKTMSDIRRHGILAYLGYPVQIDERIVGYLGVMDIQPRTFDPDDIFCISALADAITHQERLLHMENQRLHWSNLQGITSSQEHFAELMESEEKYRLVVENANDAIYILQDGHIIYANPKAVETTGLSREELADISFLALVHPDDKQDIVNKYRKRLKGEKINTTYTTRLVTRQNTTIWVQINAIEVFWDGKPAILIFTRDLSAIKKLEDQLQRAEKMEIVGTMAGGVAHDLNNILSGIVSYPELILMQTPDDDPIRELVESIHDAGMKAADLVQDLLTLTRRGVMVDDVISLNHVVRDYFDSPAHKRLEKSAPHVSFDTLYEPDLLNICGSAAHILKVVMNLVINAAESIPDPGTVSVSTSNKYVDEPFSGYDDIMEGDYVVLTVTDTGKGIAPADLGRIFEPFYTKKKMGRRSGTGLGLSVVWNTVKDHQGYIEVTSSPGRETVFELYFPATRKQSDTVESDFSIEDYMGNKESILIIDDIEQQRKIAASCLNILGYTAYSAPSGEEAIEFLKYQPVDLIILDMIMEPGIDGLETYKRILEISPDQKAIIASGFSLTHRVNEALNLGAGGYIKKPYTIKNLAKAIKKELLIF
ncbi:MAG: PAS domain S-box protein [Desulfobacteraceae bacterium]|nr:MAG: PAS domain S-box protein [Desulfobacteraceae bacterium]